MWCQGELAKWLVDDEQVDIVTLLNSDVMMQALGYMLKSLWY